LLPPYCADLYSHRDIPETAVSRWLPVLGSNPGLHHYCKGLLHLMRLATYTGNPARTNKRFEWGVVVNEFDYVLQRAKPDFILLPEILTKRAEMMANLGNRAQAIRNYQEAIDKKRDYWPPYAGLATLLKQQGQDDKAREVVEAGLAQSPDSKTLRRLEQELRSTSGGERRK